MRSIGKSLHASFASKLAKYHLAAFVASASLLHSVGSAQIVQLPTTGTFSLQTTVMAPDAGATQLGSNQFGRTGTNSRGPLPGSAYGAQRGVSGASVHTTIIDLNELDQMIRSQTGPKSTPPAIAPKLTPVSPYGVGNPGVAERNADYEYLMALSHTPIESSEQINDDAKYYLALASDARQRGHWNAVELYYKMAWSSLPKTRQQFALNALSDAKRKAESEIEKQLKKSPKR